MRNKQWVRGVTGGRGSKWPEMVTCNTNTETFSLVQFLIKYHTDFGLRSEQHGALRSSGEPLLNSRRQGLGMGKHWVRRIRCFSQLHGKFHLKLQWILCTLTFCSESWFFLMKFILNHFFKMLVSLKFQVEVWRLALSKLYTYWPKVSQNKILYSYFQFQYYRLKK